MMAAVSLVLVRYRWTLVPTLLFLLYIAVQMIREITNTTTNTHGWVDLHSPLVLTTGVLLMHVYPDTWKFAVGEGLVIFMFIANSLKPTHMGIYAACGVVALLAAWWLRGSFWRYLYTLLAEGALIVLTAVAFPLMEMVVEAVLAEKLRKVGDKVRAHYHLVQSEMGK